VVRIHAGEPRYKMNKIKEKIKSLDYYPVIIYLIILLFTQSKLIKIDFGADFLNYFIPHYHFIFTNLKNGEIPFWFPYSFLGLAEIFKSELAIFHPATISIFFLNLIFNSSNDIQKLGNIIEIVWFSFLAFGGIGMYYLNLKIFNLRKFSSFFASLVFCLNPWMLVITNTTIFLGVSILPWIFYFLASTIEKNSKRSFIGLTLANFFLFATGYPYFYIYFFLTQILFVLIVGYKKFSLPLVSIIFSGLLASFFLLPNLHIYLESHRNSVMDLETLKLTSNIPTKIANLLNPLPFNTYYSEHDPRNYFTGHSLTWGIFSFLFLIVGFLSLTRSKLNLWIISCFIIFLFYSFGPYLSANEFFSIFLPFIDKFRALFVATSICIFLGCILIAKGIEEIIQNRAYNKTLAIFLSSVIIIFFIILLIPNLNSNLINTNFENISSLAKYVYLMSASILIVYLYQKTKMKGLLFLGTFIMLIEFYDYYGKLIHTAGVSYSQNYQRNSLIPKNSSDFKKELYRIHFENNQFSYNSSMFKVFQYTGYESVTTKKWYNFVNKYGYFKSLQIGNVKYVVNTNPKWQEGNPEVVLVKIIDASKSPETFVSYIEGYPYNKANKNDIFYIYEIKNFLPRFFIPEKIKYCSNMECLVKEELPKVASIYDLNSKDVLSDNNPNNEKVVINIKEYNSSNIKLEVISPIETLIVSSEVWDKGWSGTINGTKIEILNIEGNLRGFKVPKGNSEVYLSYYQPFLNIGLVISIFGTLFFGLTIYYWEKINIFIKKFN
jgi:hypothetical protein